MVLKFLQRFGIIKTINDSILYEVKKNNNKYEIISDKIISLHIINDYLYIRTQQTDRHDSYDIYVYKSHDNTRFQAKYKIYINDNCIFDEMSLFDLLKNNNLFLSKNDAQIHINDLIFKETDNLYKQIQ